MDSATTLDTPARRDSDTLALGMDPQPPEFVRVHLICRACGEAETLDLQTHAMTLERLHCIWRRCASCLSCDLEIAEASSGHRPCPDAERHETVIRPR